MNIDLTEKWAKEIALMSDSEFEENCKHIETLLKRRKQALRIHDVVGRSEQFNCLGGNYAKGIKPCSEWCGEDMCQKPSN